MLIKYKIFITITIQKTHNTTNNTEFNLNVYKNAKLFDKISTE